MFRTFKELMINVVRHAKATYAIVEVIAKANQFSIHVKDNGHGMQNG